MALLLGCSKDTLERRFAAVIEKARSQMKMSLRRTQIKLAENGNVAMAIWLGKQYLGQREPKTTIAIEDIDNLIAAELARLARGSEDTASTEVESETVN